MSGSGYFSHLIKTNSSTIKTSCMKPSSCICPKTNLPGALRKMKLLPSLFFCVLIWPDFELAQICVSTSGSSDNLPTGSLWVVRPSYTLRGCVLDIPSLKWMFNNCLLNKWMSCMVDGGYSESQKFVILTAISTFFPVWTKDLTK